MKPRLLLLIGILMIINTCLAGVPKVLMIKRQLASSDGSVINGDTTIAICVYDVGCSGDDCPDACTGSPIVCDTQVVTVSGGYFYFKLDLSSVDDSYLSDTLYLMVSVKNGGSYEDLCPRETLYATHTYALSSHIADKSYNSDNLGGHPPDYYLDNTVDTFVAYWDSVRNMPSGFSDGVDDTGSTIGTKDTMIAYWDSLRNVPSSLSDGDDIDTFIAHWDSIRGKPQIFWLNIYYKANGDSVIDTVFNQDTVKSREIDSFDVKYIYAKHLHGGSNHWRIKAISASEQINDSTTVYLCDASSDVVTLTLTTPSNNSNRLIVVKKIDNSSNKVTIDAGSSTIDGSQTYDLTTQYQSIILICDGTKWWIIADK